MLVYFFFCKKEMDLMHPVYMFSALHAFLFIIPPIVRSSFYYNTSNLDNKLAMLLGLISYIVFSLVFLINIKFPLNSYLSKLKFDSIFKQRMNKKTIIVVTIVYSVITVIVFIFKVVKFHSVSFVLKNSFYVMNTLSKGFWFIVTLGSVFVIAYYFFTVYAYESINGKKRYFFIALYFILTVILMGIQSRSTILTMLLILVVYYNYKIKKINIRQVLALSVLVIIGMFMLNVIRQGLSVNRLFDFSSIFSSSLADANPYENMAIVLTKNSNERVWFLYLLRLPISFIPRVLWSGKPDTLLETYLMNKYLPKMYEGTMTFTLPGTLYLNAGLVSVIIGMFIYSIFMKTVYNKFTKNPSYLGLMFYYEMLIILLNGYRLSIESILSSIITSFIVFTLPFLLLNKKLNKKDMVVSKE